LRLLRISCTDGITGSKFIIAHSEFLLGSNEAADNRGRV
jgi:hypothetical protein